MQLPKNIRQRLSEELRFAADKMREEKDPFRKLYFFSAMYGEVSRILNWTWDRDLALIHSVLLYTHQQVSGRLQVISSGRERSVRLPEMLFELLVQASDDLARFFEEEQGKQDLSEIMGRFAELAYATTGNGYYLLEKGLIKLRH